jgi:hypothetical protein
MKSKIASNALLAVLLVIIAGCTTMGSLAHNVMMKGQVLDVADKSAYLCIGSKDGAEVGQEYAVYKFSRAMNPNPKYAAQPYFKRDKVGRIKITEIVDEHMAKASIVRGEVKTNDFVELE